MTYRIRIFFARLMLAGICLLSATGPAVAHEKPLVLGIFPYLSGYAVVNKFTPLRDYLAHELEHPVQVYTAADFPTFIERTQRGEYDIALTAPHLARLAMLEGGYIPLATYKAKLQTLILVKKDSPHTRLADLRGKSIAIPDRLAIVSMLGQQLLLDAGLVAARDYQLAMTRSHSSAALSVQLGRNDAAIVGSTMFKQLTPEAQAELRPLAHTPAMPTQYYIAHKRLGSRKIEQLRNLLEKFSNSTAAGKKFIAENRFEGIEPVNVEELKALDRFAQEVKRLQENNDF